jgi:long-chain fatty acid transport protein
VGRGLGGGAPVDQQKTLSGNRVSGEFDNTWIEALIAHLTWHY